MSNRFKHFEKSTHEEKKYLSRDKQFSIHLWAQL